MSQGNLLFERLRQATRLAHRRLERRMDLYRPNFDLHHYLRLLQDCWGFYRPLERKLVVLADHLLPSPYSQQRLKTPRLHQDLLTLGMTEGDIDALPLCGRLPAIPSPVQAFGVLYVVEEATLSGQLTLPSLRDKLGISPSQGGSFFASYGPLVDHYWQEFQAAMIRVVEEPQLQEVTIRAAVDSFDCFDAWLDYRHRTSRADHSYWRIEASRFDSISGAA